VEFTEAGSKTVTSEGHIQSTPQVRRVRFLAGMEPRGHQENAKWIDAPLDIRCGGAAPPAAAGRPGAPTGAASRVISLPPGTQVEVELKGTALKLKPEEQVAFLFVYSMLDLEKEECSEQLGRLCALDEIVSGVPGKDGRTIGLATNPNEDANYRYTLTISGKRYEAAAVPRHPGLAGFLYVSPDGFGIGDFYFNAAGPAASSNETLTGFGHSGNDFRRRQ